MRCGEVTREMNWSDVERARLVEEVGMGQPVAYTDHERKLISTHEAGHATRRLPGGAGAPSRGADDRQAALCPGHARPR